MNFQLRSRRDFLQLLFVCALPLLALPLLTGPQREETEGPLEFDGKRLANLREHPPEIILLGNSMVHGRLNTSHLPLLLKPLGVATISEGGTRTLQWFLWFKNYVAATRPPAKLVFIFYRDYDFNRVGTRIEGTFLDSIRKTMREGDQTFLSLARGEDQESGPLAWLKERYGALELNSHLRKKVDHAAMDMAALLGGAPDDKIEEHVQNLFDLKNLRGDVRDAGAMENDNPKVAMTQFTSAPEKNFLSHFSSVAKASGIKLVFYRVRRRPNEANQVEQSDSLREYTSNFKIWAEANGHMHLDETDDGRITPQMFRDGDHLLRAHSGAYTEMFVERIRRLLPEPFTPEEIAAGN